MPLETKINIAQGIVSLLTFAGGAVWFLMKRWEKQHEHWVHRFLENDERLPEIKITLIKKAVSELSYKFRVKKAFLKACDLSGRYPDDGHKHFEKMWKAAGF